MTSKLTDSKWVKATWGLFVFYLVIYALCLIFWSLLLWIALMDFIQLGSNTLLLTSGCIEIVLICIFVLLVLGIKAHEKRKAYPSWALSGLSAVFMVITLVRSIVAFIHGNRFEFATFTSLTILYLATVLVSSKSAHDLQTLKSIDITEQLVNQSSSEEEAYLIGADQE